MAKKKELTPEETLQQALVPKEEQPYPLPEGWRWVRLGDIAEWGSGGTPSRKIASYYKGSIPWLKTGDLNNGYIFFFEEHISEDALTHSSAKLFPVNTVVVAMYGATIGKVGILRIEAATNQACACGIPWQGVNYKYLFYYIQSQADNFIRKSKGGAQPNISQNIIKKHVFPLPPFYEQEKIVEKIGKLFNKLEKVKSKIQYISNLSEQRKAAILHKAFTGEFTAKWREENKISFETWRVVSFNEVAAIKSNLVDPKEYQDYPHIAPDNIEKRTGKLLEYHSVREDKVKSNKHRFYSGQILYSKIRPYLSKVIMVDFDGLCSADMYPIEAAECVKYLWYYMLSDIFLQQASTAGSRSVLPKINQKELSKIKTPMPSRQEQERIVYILDHLFAKEEIIAQQIQKISNIIQILKKSILGKAFRGNIT